MSLELLLLWEIFMMITILLVTCLPILYTVILSFTNYNMYHLGDYTFVGADNYLTVFSGSIKSVFFPVLGWTICFAIFSTVGSYAMGLLLAAAFLVITVEYVG